MFKYIFLLSFFILNTAYANINKKEEIQFAIFAYRPISIMHERYDPIVKYLNENLTRHYINVEYLSMDGMYEALHNNEIEIFFTTPAQYINLRYNNNLASTFATLLRNSNGQKLSMLGGVIVVKKDRDDINTLEDIIGKKVVTAGKRYFGGYSVLAYELYEHNIDIQKESAKLIEAGTHDKAISTLLKDNADVAFVRTGILEQLVKENKVDLDEFKIINQQNIKNYPYLLSTRLYPEWPLVALPHVSDDFLRELSFLLFSLTPQNNITKNTPIAGFVPPKDYLEVEKVLRTLRLKPFDKVDDFTYVDIFEKYLYEVIAVAFTILVFILFFVLIYKKNQQLITSRNSYKNLAKELEKSRFLNKNILNTISDLIWLKDKNGVYITCNPEFEDFFGAKEDEISGKTDYDFVDKELADSFREHDKKAMDSDLAVKNEEWVVYAKDGRKVLLETTKQKLVNSDGSIFGVLGIAHDITQRHNLQNQLEEEKNRFSLAIEGAQDGLWDWNLLTDEVYLTERFETMLGYDVGELPQNTQAWFGLLHPDDKSDTEKVVKEYLEQKGKGNYENTFRLRSKDGSWRWILGRGKAQFDKNGKPVRFVGFNTDISKQVEYQKKLDHIAKHDVLTQLPNRFLLSELLTYAMHKTKRENKYLALLFIDLDGFKDVNDTYGHDIGDEVLLSVASKMNDIIRESDIVSRIGGDEFVVVASGLHSHNEIFPLLQRLLSDLSSDIIYDDKRIKISASIGVSFYPQIKDIGNESLIRQADQAMYDAKLSGKNQYKFFNIAASQELQKQQEILVSLHNAIENKELVLYYQPKINMQNNKFVGLEALVRWEHPDNGLLFPDSFLPMVEDESSIMIELGKYVFETAFSQLDKWHKEGLNLSLSVNVSSYEIQEQGFPDYLKTLFDKYTNIDPNLIEIEILETAAFENFAQTSKILQECKDLGIGIAIDDFGTGYASLHYLKKLPMNTLKIDRSFVIDMLNGSQNISIVESSIGLAHAFNANVVAEGVESEEHGKILKQLGCDYAQGYAISKAMPAEEVVGWIESWKGYPSWEDTKTINEYKRNIIHIIVEHKRWINEINKFIKNEITELPQLNQEDCILGNWILNEATKEQRENPIFEQIDKKHKELHEYVKKILVPSKNKVDSLYTLEEKSQELIKLLEEINNL